MVHAHDVSSDLITVFVKAFFGGIHFRKNQLHICFKIYFCMYVAFVCAQIINAKSLETVKFFIYFNIYKCPKFLRSRSVVNHFFVQFCGSKICLNNAQKHHTNFSSSGIYAQRGRQVQAQNFYFRSPLYLVMNRPFGDVEI